MGNHPNDFDDRWGGQHIKEDMVAVKKKWKTVNGVKLPANQELPKQCPTHDCDWWPVTASTGVYMHCPLCYASLSQWVNVEERMPTLDGEYWCHVEPKNPFLSEIHGYDDGLITPKFDPYERTVKTFRTNAGELRFNCGGLERVTFWMSLPKFLPESFNKEEL